MPNDNVVQLQGPAQPPVQLEPDAFGDLLSRFMVAVSQMQLIEVALEDLPEDQQRHHAAAAYMTGVVADDLQALYNDLDQWHVRHIHQPKEFPS